VEKAKVIIAIDDLHPEKGWGCEGDESVEYLKNLWEEFGCKFTLFIPSNYHGEYPLSEHRDWVEYWKRKPWVELAAHGHYHQCEREDIGECEFFELDSNLKAIDRIMKCLTEWRKVDYTPKGWRNPGWLAHPDAIKELGKYFKYAAIHTEHNHGIPWSCKTFEGCDGINETDNINMYNGDTFMFQSHIAGDWNHNIWNKENYENFKNILEYLSESYILNYYTLGEL
tara:strand:+ start:1907 stop:2584 length:678 start_codon:yes stop_codon:yes gene_type:complete